MKYLPIVPIVTATLVHEILQGKATLVQEIPIVTTLQDDLERGTSN